MKKYCVCSVERFRLFRRTPGEILNKIFEYAIDRLYNLDIGEVVIGEILWKDFHMRLFLKLV